MTVRPVTMLPDTDILIVHYNHPSDTAEALRGLLAWVDDQVREYRIVVNGTDGEPLRDLPDTSKLRIITLDENRGYSAAVNAGAADSSARYLFLLNNDILVHEDVLAPLRAALDADSHLGIVAPRLLYRDGSFQISSGADPSLLTDLFEKIRQRQSRGRRGLLYRWAQWRSRRSRNVHWVTGAAMLMRRSVFEAVGGFDEGYFMYFEDSDFCRRVRKAGFRVRLVAEASLVHFLGGAGVTAHPRLRKAFRDSQWRYYRTHASPLSRLLLRFYRTLKIRILESRTPSLSSESASSHSAEGDSR